MKSTIFIILLVMASCECFSQVNNDAAEIVTDTILTPANLDDYVNKLVTIKGEILNTKIPQIIGIDVDCTEYHPEGKIGIATGILIKTVVLEKDVDPYSTNRGAGTFYRLKAPGSESDAEVIILKN